MTAPDATIKIEMTFLNNFSLLYLLCSTEIIIALLSSTITGVLIFYKNANSV